MNTFLELAESRYSVRKYDPRPIEKEKLDRILRAGQISPTAANRQPQKITVLQSAEAIEKVRQLTPYAFNAPTILMICADREEAWTAVDGHNSAYVDAAIVITQMMLQAWDEGIGSCWVRGFDKNKLVEAFDLPANLELVALLPIGYPAGNAKPAAWHYSRKPLDEMVSYL